MTLMINIIMITTASMMAATLRISTTMVMTRLRCMGKGSDDCYASACGSIFADDAREGYGDGDDGTADDDEADEGGIVFT